MSWAGYPSQGIPILDYLKSRLLASSAPNSGWPALPRDLRTPRYVRLRELLVEARKSAGLSQTAVAERLGRPQSYVADVERNERRIDVIEFLALAEAIGCDPIEVLEQVRAEPAT